MAVPLFDTSTPLAPLRERLHAKLAELLDAGRYILGPEVAGFEADIAAYDAVYKRLIREIELSDVSSSFAMEQIKYTTALPLDYA